jgi:hypothetical protein
VAGVGIATLLVASSSLLAREMPPPEQLERQIKEIEARYEPRFNALKAAGDEATKDMPSKEEMALGVSFGRMKRVDWYVKIPELVVRQQTWYVRIPEFKMVLRRIVWHVPEPCMKYEKFPWGGGMHRPAVCMREKDWRFHVPEVSMREQKWILGIPEVTMKEQHWGFDFPEVTVEDSKNRVNDAEKKAAAVGKQAQQTSDEMNAEIKRTVSAYMVEAREVVVEQFDTHINTLRAAVASAPAQAKDELNRKLSEMEEERAKALNTIDAQIKSES